MRVRFAVLLAFACAALLAAVPAFAGPDGAVLDANQQTSGYSAYYICPQCGTPYAGETFTAQHTGSIVQIDLDAFQSWYGGAANVTVDVETTANGRPSGVVLGSATLSTSSFSTNWGSFGSVPFSTPVPVVAGTSYAWVVHTDGSALMLVNTAGSNGYGARTADFSGAWNTGTWAYRVWVSAGPPPDKTAPVFDTASNVTAEATGPAGAVVSYTAPAANDAVDGSVPVSCSPASGSTFALGTTEVDCSAFDKAGNTATTSVKVTVQDTTAPAFGAVSDVTAEATGPTGAAVTYTTPTATDLVDGSTAVSCSPVSGSMFALGTTTVGCSTSDAAGNTATTSFDVTVQDTTAPALSLPADITTDATSPSGAAVTYSATATDLVDGAVPVACAPASGSTFAAGLTTTVSCSATDAHGNTASGSFSVTVRSPAQMLASLETVAASTADASSLGSKLSAADASLAAGNKTAAKNQLNAFLNEVKAQTGKKLTAAQAASLTAAAQNLLRAIG